MVYLESLGAYYGGLGGMFGGLGGMPMMMPPEVAAGEQPAAPPTRDDVHDHAATTVVQIIRTYCYGMHAAQVADLKASVDAGRFPWLREELQTAVESRVWNDSEWADLIGSTHRVAVEHGQRARQEQLHLQQVLFPDGLTALSLADEQTPAA